MIVVKLIGGLGNQMFQYAFGRNLARIKQTEMKLDITGFETYKLHTYSLRHFNIKESLATKAEISQLTKHAAKKGKIWCLRNYLFSDASIFVKEKRSMEFKFDSTIMTIGDTAYLNGYWQNEKYFQDIEEVIGKEFVVRDAMGDEDKAMAQSIAQTNSVSVHIRRGDYVASAKTNAVHGTCDINYYQRATKLISEKIIDPHFFVFSDDHEWVKKNIIFDFPTTYVAHNIADKNYQDLRLMSMCHHNIIANSSFSWWGAWLNVNSNKIIVAPKKWLNDSTRDASDITPKTWNRI